MINPCDDSLINLCAAFLAGAVMAWPSGVIGGIVIGRLTKTKKEIEE